MPKALVQPNAGLTTVPAQMVGAMDIERVDLSNNAIQEVPGPAVVTLSQLLEANFSSNQLVALPQELSACLSLQVLALGNNKLSAFPECILALPNLTHLYLNNNAITDIPSGISSLTNLQVLDASHNRLRVVPADLGWLNLSDLRLEGNPDLRIPPVVMQRGFRAVMSYLQVICEQHRLVEQHLDKFAAPAADGLDTKELAKDAVRLAEAINKRLDTASTTGVLDLKRLGYPEALLGIKSLSAVYVADVRYNRWESIPPDVVGLSGLVVLNASDNNIRMVADGITPENLGVLNLSFNALETLPSALGKAPVLQQMYLANNQLTGLPASFAGLPMVDLFLSENNFTSIPQAVLGMTQLAKLSIACCSINEVPDGLSNVSTLKFLDLSFNNLTCLPGTLSKLTQLNALNVSFNPLNTFPEVVPTLTSLLELNLDHTHISDVPAELGCLRSLEGLQMEGCPLASPLDKLYAHSPLLLVQVHNTALVSLDLSGLSLPLFPRQLSRLTALTALNLAQNELADIPREIGALTALQHLNVRENPLVQPFKNLVDVQGDRALVDFYNATSDKIDLTNCGLTSFPQQLAFRASKVVQLKAAHNKLVAIPSFLSTFTQLTTAVLDNNELVGLPEALLKLPKLNILMASSNRIMALPLNIGDYTQLQALVLQDNAISDIPTSISKLTELKALSLATNKLHMLPPAVCSCTALRLLDISYNGITLLPDQISGLSKLKTLKLAFNKLGWVPPALASVSGLQELYLEGNPLPLEKLPQGVGLNAVGAIPVRTLVDALVVLGRPATPVQQAPTPLQPSTPTKVAAAPTPPAAPLAAVKELVASAAAPPSASQPGAALPSAAVATAAAATAAPKADASAAATHAASAHAAVSGASIAVPVGGPLGSLAEDNVVANIAALRVEAAEAPKLEPPPLPKYDIKTQEDPDMISKRLDDLRMDIKAMDPGSKWLFVQKHAEMVQKDPLRKPSGWDTIPLMNIPRIIAAISSPPPPPKGGVARDGKPTRPQAMHRFRRIVDQSATAMQLLGRVNEVLGQKAAGGMGSTGSMTAQFAAGLHGGMPGSPAHGGMPGMGQGPMPTPPQQHQQHGQQQQQRSGGGPLFPPPPGLSPLVLPPTPPPPGGLTPGPGHMPSMQQGMMPMSGPPGMLPPQAQLAMLQSLPPSMLPPGTHIAMLQTPQGPAPALMTPAGPFPIVPGPTGPVVITPQGPMPLTPPGMQMPMQM